jgi:hypothetical protein
MGIARGAACAWLLESNITRAINPAIARQSFKVSSY